MCTHVLTVTQQSFKLRLYLPLVRNRELNQQINTLICLLTRGRRLCICEKSASRRVCYVACGVRTSPLSLLLDDSLTLSLLLSLLLLLVTNSKESFRLKSGGRAGEDDKLCARVCPAIGVCAVVAVSARNERLERVAIVVAVCKGVCALKLCFPCASRSLRDSYKGTRNFFHNVTLVK